MSECVGFTVRDGDGGGEVGAEGKERKKNEGHHSISEKQKYNKATLIIVCASYLARLLSFYAARVVQEERNSLPPPLGNPPPPQNSPSQSDENACLCVALSHDPDQGRWPACRKTLHAND